MAKEWSYQYGPECERFGCSRDVSTRGEFCSPECKQKEIDKLEDQLKELKARLAQITLGSTSDITLS